MWCVAPLEMNEGTSLGGKGKIGLQAAVPKRPHTRPLFILFGYFSPEQFGTIRGSCPSMNVAHQIPTFVSRLCLQLRLLCSVLQSFLGAGYSGVVQYRNSALTGNFDRSVIHHELFQIYFQEPWRLSAAAVAMCCTVQIEPQPPHCIASWVLHFWLQFSKPTCQVPQRHP